MKIAFVTPRYGEQVFGGAEHAARMFAEQLAQLGHEVAVFSSCAIDSRTWQNELPPGSEALNGVTVRRFPNERRSRHFERYSDALRPDPSSVTDEEHDRWLELQGPTSSALVEAVRTSGVDVVVGYPYLYYPIVNSLLSFEGPTVLHPAAHDEWILHLPRYRQLMKKVSGVVFHTDAERELCREVFGELPGRQLRLGLGTDLINDSSDEFDIRSRFGINENSYLLYLGRVDNGKAVSALVSYFLNYKIRRPSDLRLVLAGPILDKQVDDSDVLVTGPVDETVKASLLRNAICVVSASSTESFGLVLQEAWSAGKPVLVNRASEAFSELVTRREAGLLFSGYGDFEASLDVLLNSSELRIELGRRGQQFVVNHAQWRTIGERYNEFLMRFSKVQSNSGI